MYQASPHNPNRASRSTPPASLAAARRGERVIVALKVGDLRVGVALPRIRARTWANRNRTWLTALLIAASTAALALGIDEAEASGQRLASLSPTPQLHALVNRLPMIEFEGLGLPEHGGALQAHVRARSLGLGTLRAGTALLGGRVDAAWTLAANTFARASSTLQWPVEAGWLTRGYGSGEDGYHLATDIMAATGEEVRAVADGLVGYADNKLRGYGNIVMLIHPGGRITAYAHNKRNHVRAGQVVRRGELIAEVGSTGISRGPHVHFEMMADGKNCDPTALFRPGVPKNHGGRLDVQPREWRINEEAPVRCERRRRHPHTRYTDHADDDEH